MKKHTSTLLLAGFILVCLAAACSNSVKTKLKGSWRSRDGAVKLHITDKSFMTDDDESIAEDYFIKDDTIFTSFQGNQPYTKFVIQKLDDRHMTLLGPDSVTVEYSR
jgi:hypothetical protein